jgi:oligosaccharide repeat unit polymerase
MTVIAFIFSAIFLTLFLTLFKKDTDVFAPARLFTLVWSFAIGLVGFQFSGLQKIWSIYSWLVLIITLLSVLLGMFVVYVHYFGAENKSISQIRNSITNATINPQPLFKWVIILFVAYVISYISIYLVTGFIPFFTARPDLTRTKWGFFGVGLIVHSVPTIIYFVIIYYIKVHGEFVKKFLLTLILVISFISYSFLLQRFDLVIFMILATVFLYYGTTKLKIRYILIFLIGLITFMYGVSTLRASNLFLEYLYYGGKMKFGKEFAIFTEPYMYVVMNLENFANAVNKLSNFSFGFYTFDFVLALTGLKHLLFDYGSFQTFPFIVDSSYNTYTMFFVYYRDFGIIGSFIFPFSLGVGIYGSYFHLKRKPNLNSISLYGVFVFVILFSFFIPMLSWLHFVYNLTIIYLISKHVVVNKPLTK